MKAAVINGSPKTGSSASGRIIGMLREKLIDKVGDISDLIVVRSAAPPEKALAEARLALEGAQAIVLVTPLYVDSLPSHVISLLEALVPEASFLAPEARLYCVVNCGFWEPDHNALALEQLRLFAKAASLPWGQGLAFGGGGAAAKAPKFFLKTLDRALQGLTGKILSGSSAPDHHFRVNMPRSLYRFFGNLQWRWLARRNGLSGADLYRRPI